jgi:amino acid transporter
VFFNTFDIRIDGSYLPAFLTASLAGMFLYYGFEACGDVAEETPNPSKQIPRAMRMTIWIGGAAAMFACLALILAVPDMNAVINGTDKDPVTTILSMAFGVTGSKVVMGIVMVSFISCVISLQAAASRLLYAYARDEMIVGSRPAQKASRPTPRSRSPRCSCPAYCPRSSSVLGFVLQDAVATIVSFAAIGIYLAFQMIVLAALFARTKGWIPSGQFSLA